MKPIDPHTPTLHQVAHAAGVSPATVSRFLNGTAKVGDEKRKSIEGAIELLHYKPNLLAQSLKMGSTRTIGVLTQSLVSGYFTDAMTGIEDTVKKSGYALLIMSGHWNAAQEAERVELLIGRRADGVVILTGNLSDEQITGFSHRVPIVALGRKLEGERVRGICLDNYHAACEAMDLLIEQGHRRIVFIGGPGEQEDARARLEGYRDTLTRHGIAIDPALIVAGDFQESGGLMAVDQLLATGQRFTAIFCGNDLTAYGARLALYRRSIRVPEDVSIMGFDDLHSSMYTTPPLTTVRQPQYDIGACMGQMILGMINHETTAVEIPPLSLVVRESVRRIT